MSCKDAATCSLVLLASSLVLFAFGGGGGHDGGGGSAQAAASPRFAYVANLDDDTIAGASPASVIPMP